MEGIDREVQFAQIARMTTVSLYVAEGRIWELRVGDPRAEIGVVPAEHRRLFRLLKLYGLADQITDAPKGVRAVDCLALDVTVVNELALVLRGDGI